MSHGYTITHRIVINRKGFSSPLVRKGRLVKKHKKLFSLLENRVIHWHQQRVTATQVNAAPTKGLYLEED